MWRLLTGTALAYLLGCAPAPVELEVPDEVAWVGWLELDSTGSVLRASALFDLRNERAFVDDVPSDDVVVVGVGAEVIGDPGNDTMQLAGSCQATLPVLWTADRRGAPVIVPALTLPSVDAACRREGAYLPEAACRGVRCPLEPCADIELDVHLLEVGPSARAKDLHDVALLPWGDLAVLAWNDRTVFTVSDGVVTSSATIPGRGPLVSLAAAADEVLVGDNGGTIHVLDQALAMVRTDQPLRGRVRLVSRAGRVLAHDYGGAVVERVRGTYVRREDLPANVLALDFDETRVAWIDELRSVVYRADAQTTTLDRLPSDRETPPVVALTPEGVVAGVHGTLRRYRPTTEPQTLPWGDGFDVADELRALRYAEGVWASGNGARWRRYDGWAACDVTTGLSRPFNALITGAAGAVTAVTSGEPFVVEATRKRQR